MLTIDSSAYYKTNVQNNKFIQELYLILVQTLEIKYKPIQQTKDIIVDDVETFFESGLFTDYLVESFDYNEEQRTIIEMVSDIVKPFISIDNRYPSMSVLTGMFDQLSKHLHAAKFPEGSYSHLRLPLRLWNLMMHSFNFFDVIFGRCVFIGNDVVNYTQVCRTISRIIPTRKVANPYELMEWVSRDVIVDSIVQHFKVYGEPLKLATGAEAIDALIDKLKEEGSDTPTERLTIDVLNKLKF